MLYGIILLIPPVLGALISVYYRAMYLLDEVNPVSMLPAIPAAHGMIFWLFALSTAVLCIGTVFTGRAVRRKRRNPCPAAHGTSSALFPAVGCISALILLGSAGNEMYMYSMSRTITDLIFGVLTLLCAAAVALLSLKRLALRESAVYNLLAAIPTFWACYALILIFRTRIAEPAVSNYICLLMAFICVLLFCYCLCAYVFGKRRFTLLMLCVPFGVFFCLVEIFAPMLAGVLRPGAQVLSASLRELLPLAAMLVYMPFALCEMLKNNNNV